MPSRIDAENGTHGGASGRESGRRWPENGFGSTGSVTAAMRTLFGG